LGYHLGKVECKHPTGLLQPISIPKWKWEVISMDLITRFPRTGRQHDSIMVVVGRLSKVSYFIPMDSTISDSEVSHIFITKIMRFHGVPKKIISDSDAKFTCKFPNVLFAGLRTDLAFNITYHPHTDGHTKRVNKIIELIMRMYAMHQ